MKLEWLKWRQKSEESGGGGLVSPLSLITIGLKGGRKRIFVSRCCPLHAPLNNVTGPLHP